MATIVLLLIILLGVAVFSVQNAVPVTIHFLFWQFEGSLAIVIFLSAVGGMIAGALVASFIRFRSSPGKESEKPPTVIQ